MTDPGSVHGHGRLHGAGAGARPGGRRARATSSRSARCSTRCSPARRAFKRATAAETMTAILREIRRNSPGRAPGPVPALERIVRHCLEKNPAERFQTARDVAFALEALSGSAASARGPVRARLRFVHQGGAGGFAGCAVIVIGTAVGAGVVVAGK